MSTNKRERDSDTPGSVSSSESQRPMLQEDGPRVIAGSRRVNKDLSASGSCLAQSQHQPNQQQLYPPHLPISSTATSEQPTQPADRSITSVPSTPTYALPVYSDELGRLPLHGHVNFSTPTYLDQESYWYHGFGAIESSPNSDHIIPPNSVSHQSNRPQHQQFPDHPVQSSHISFSNDTTEARTITQGVSPNPTIGTGNIMLDPVPLTYITPTKDARLSLPIDIGPSQNPLRRGGGPSHSSSRGIPLTLRDDRGDGSVLEHHQHHTQDPHEDDHGNHHHREQQQQQQPMGYSLPTGFEYVFFCRRGSGD